MKNEYKYAVSFYLSLQLKYIYKYWGAGGTKKSFHDLDVLIIKYFNNDIS